MRAYVLAILVLAAAPALSGCGTDPCPSLDTLSAPDAAEDDGWVLTLVADPDRGASDLWVLHAADPAGDPAAVVHLPARVPLGFHGNWVPSSS